MCQLINDIYEVLVYQNDFTSAAMDDYIVLNVPTAEDFSAGVLRGTCIIVLNVANNNNIELCITW